MKKILIIISSTIFLLFLAIAGLLFCGVNNISLSSTASESTNQPRQVDPREFADELFALANSERKVFPSELQWNDCLATKAVERANYIVSNNLFDHQNKEGNYPYENLVDSCYKSGFKFAGENLTRHTSPEEAHRAFMDSSAHRANIMSVDFTEMGVGCYQDVCVEFFGTPFNQ